MACGEKALCMKGEKLQEYPKLLLSKSELHHFFFDQFCPNRQRSSKY